MMRIFVCMMVGVLLNFLSVAGVEAKEARKSQTGVTILKRDKCDNGYRLYNSRQTEVAHMIDIDGREVHRWAYPQGKSWHYAEMQPNGNLIAIVKDVMILELDWNSNLVWKFRTRAHHDFARLPNGNTLVVSRRRMEFPRVNPDKALSYDTILEVTPQNKIVWRWNVEEHVGELGKLVPLELPCTEFRDWPHINTCEVLPDSPTARKDARFKAGNLLICGRHIDTIAVIDRKSGKVLWAWGPGTIQGPHMPTMLPNGNILLFDNGRHTAKRQRGYTRVIELNPLTKKIVWEYESKGHFFSPARGSNQRLPNGDTLIAEADRGRLFEVTREGEIVWEFRNPDRQAIYRTVRYPRELVDKLVAEHRAAESAAVVERPRTDTRNDFYVGNREPLTPSPFLKLPIGSIKPKGWLLRRLRLEADGFFGHVTELSRFLNKKDNAWLSPKGEGRNGWEEVPYWLRGFGDLGYVLGDQRIIKEMRPWIEAAIASQRDDGYFGPRSNLKNIRRRGTAGKPDLWPNMLMLNVLQSYYEFSGDRRVPDLMTKYFKWEMTVPDEDFLLPFWQNQRAGDNLASVYWLYNRTGEKWLLELGEKIHRNTAKWVDGIASWHNVNIAQAFREPAEFYQQSKNPKDLRAAERNYQEVWQRYGQVPGGMFGGDENCRPGHFGPRQAIETCGMVEMMHSCEMLTKIDDGGRWADRCEDVAFNSLPAATTADFKALRYLTAPNLVLSDRTSKSPGVQNGGPMMLMSPHLHRCCQHNMGHGWPYLAEHLWMATPDNGLAAVFYCASEVSAKVGSGAKVGIAEETRYPFDEKVTFRISTPAAVRFPLYLRVPGWCKSPDVTVNGKKLAVRGRPNSYIVIDRTWANGDSVVLNLPMRITLRVWKKNKNCVSVNYGPLTFSLKIGEKYVPLDAADYLPQGLRKQLPPEAMKWRAWEIYPTTPWNYGLIVNAADPAASFSVRKKGWPSDDDPWKSTEAPIELKAKGRRIAEWKQDEHGLVGPIPQSPVKTDEKVESLTLIPMGCARLRISAFPTVTAE